MQYSFKPHLHSYRRKNGTCKIYLQVIIDRKKNLFDLKLEWPPRYFDKKTGRCLPQKDKDPDVNDFNLILMDSSAKANEIFKGFRLRGEPVTMEAFTTQWNNTVDRSDFIQYMEAKIYERMRSREIADGTVSNHFKALRKLKLFRDVILFADLNQTWAKRFDNFLSKTTKSQKTNGINSRWTHHKCIRAYMTIARKEDQINFVHPYHYFTPKTTESTWRPIYEEDLKKLVNYYHTEARRAEVLVLRRFLFGCCTSLRISDLKRVKEDWLHKDGIMRYVAKKNRKQNKQIQIPLTGLASELFQAAVKDAAKGDCIFDNYSEQPSNRLLKAIAKKLGISVDLHHHVARSTFITLYIKKTKQLDMAQHYAGHSNIRQTMVYNHIDHERIKNEIIDFSDL